MNETTVFVRNTTTCQSTFNKLLFSMVNLQGGDCNPCQIWQVWRRNKLYGLYLTGILFLATSVNVVISYRTLRIPLIKIILVNWLS